MNLSCFRNISVLLVTACTVGGCVGPNTALDNAGASVDGASNSAFMGADGWSANLQGSAPTFTVVDSDGVNQVSEGPYRTAGVATEGVKFFLTDPSDTNIGTLSITLPDGTTLAMSDFGSSNSAVISAHDVRVVEALRVQGIITQSQADVAVQAIRSGQETLADVLARVIRP